MQVEATDRRPSPGVEIAPRGGSEGQRADRVSWCEGEHRSSVRLRGALDSTVVL